MILDFLHIEWSNLYVIGHPAWLQKAKQGRPTTAKKKVEHIFVAPPYCQTACYVHTLLCVHLNDFAIIV